MSIVKNAGTVGAMTSLSRVLGLVRDMLQARLIGAGVVQSAFVLAFAIPNMVRKLFGEGALTAAFVPVFKGEVAKLGVAEASKLACAVLTMMLLLLGVTVLVTIAVLLGVLGLVQGLSPRAHLTLELVVLLLPYMIFICGAAFGMGVLNSLGRFGAASFTPALLNVFWIAALAILSWLPFSSPEMRILIVEGGILLGGFLQMAFMFHCMKRMGVSPCPLFRGWNSEKVRLVWRNLGVGALGAGAVQVNCMLDQVLGQLAAPWAAGVISYSERLMDLPLGIIGVSFGTVLLPTFSGHFADNDWSGARAALLSSVKSMLFVMIPASAGLFILAPEVTRVIYEGGAFNDQATVRVYRALSVYALGLVFFGIQKVLIPWFQAQKNLKTPLRVSIWTVCLNAALNILAVRFLPTEWRHVGLAASTSFCALVGCMLLYAQASRRNGSLGLGVAVLPVLRMLGAAFLMLGALWCAKRMFVNTPVLWALICEVALGGLTYLACAAIFLRQELKELWIRQPTRSSS